MKRWKKLLAGVLAIAMALSCVPSYGVKAEEGETLVYGGFQYKINEAGDSVTITDHKGSDEVVEIPSEIDGKKVTNIGNDVFSYHRSLKRVTIPNSVTGIGDRAFNHCSDLTAMTIPNSVTSIGHAVFMGCSGLTSIIVEKGNSQYDSRNDCNAIVETESNALILGCKKTVIPNNITSIGSYAFSGCAGLKSLIIPNSVKIIEYNAFDFCSGLKSVTIPNSVTSIGHAAFRGCSALTRVTIPNRMTSIEASAFYGCAGLKSVTIPNSVTSIGMSAFLGCAGLKSVTIPKSVTNIGGSAIGYLNGATKIPGFVIYGIKGSEAERYAKNNGFTFRLSSEGGSSQGDKITCKKTVYKVTYGAKPFKINASSKSRMAFTSSKPKVATVDKNTGKVTIKNTGIATITIKAGKASKKVTIKISPKKPSVKSVKAAKGRRLAVKWAKDKRASGYQVQISTDKKFEKNVKSQKLSKTSYTFTKLKTGKNYYVKIRSYKKSGKETLYSAWSKVKQGGKI